MAAALPSLPECCDECTTCNTTIVIPSAGEECPPLKSLDEARALTAAEAAGCGVININGQMTGGDGFSGIFTWDALSALPDDGADVLEVSDAPSVGRLIRQT